MTTDWSDPDEEREEADDCWFGLWMAVLLGGMALIGMWAGLWLIDRVFG